MSEAILTCPKCGHKQPGEIPADACIPFYRCDGCGQMINPKAGDCCVFCSYGDRACPAQLSSREVKKQWDSKKT